MNVITTTKNEDGTTTYSSKHFDIFQGEYVTVNGKTFIIFSMFDCGDRQASCICIPENSVLCSNAWRDGHLENNSWIDAWLHHIIVNNRLYLDTQVLNMDDLKNSDQIYTFALSSLNKDRYREKFVDAIKNKFFKE